MSNTSKGIDLENSGALWRHVSLNTKVNLLRSLLEASGAKHGNGTGAMARVASRILHGIEMEDTAMVLSELLKPLLPVLAEDKLEDQNSFGAKLFRNPEVKGLIAEHVRRQITRYKDHRIARISTRFNLSRKHTKSALETSLEKQTSFLRELPSEKWGEGEFEFTELLEGEQELLDWMNRQKGNGEEGENSNENDCKECQTDDSWLLRGEGGGRTLSPIRLRPESPLEQPSSEVQEKSKKKKKR